MVRIMRVSFEMEIYIEEGNEGAAIDELAGEFSNMSTADFVGSLNIEHDEWASIDLVPDHLRIENSI